MEVKFSGYTGIAFEPIDYEIYENRSPCACRLSYDCWYNRCTKKIESRAGLCVAQLGGGDYVNFIPKSGQSFQEIIR